MSRRGKRDIKSETRNGSKTRLYQIVHTTESLFLIVELGITLSKNGTRDIYFFLNYQQNAFSNILCQTQYSFF